MNYGRRLERHGVYKKLYCEYCGEEMNVIRNIYGHRPIDKSLVSYLSCYDIFTCPTISEPWHKRICELENAKKTETDTIVLSEINMELGLLIHMHLRS